MGKQLQGERERKGWEYLESDVAKRTVSETCIYIKSEK